ncbi:MAG: ATP-binding protein [Myxococcales bacterium]
MTARSRTSRPNFESIDRRLAFSFLALAGGLVAAVVVVGMVLYLQILRGEQERLASVIASALRPGLESVRAAGRFRLESLAAKLRRENEALVYLRVVDSDGVAVQEGPEPEDVLETDASARQCQGIAVRPARVGGAAVTEIVDQLRGGYGNAAVATVRIGVKSEPLARSGPRAVGILAAVLLALLACSWPVIRWLSRRLGAPVQTLARDFAGVMDHAPLHVAIEDAQGVIDRASVTFQKAFGVQADDAPRTRSLLPAGALDDLQAHPEVKVVLQGAERTLHLARFPVLLAPDGQVLRSALVGTDVTAWRRDQAERDRLAAAVESSADALLIVEPGRGVVYANPALFARTGFDRAEVLQQDPALLLPADHEGRKALSGIERGSVWGGVIAARRKAGPPWQCDLLVSPIVAADGQVRSEVWVARDVSRETELEAQLRQSQKMEAIGLLAGGVAHDFNNLLTVVLSAAEMLLDAPLGEEQRRDVQTISEAGQRATDLTRQLLAFSRRQHLTIQPLALNDVVAQSLSLLRRGLGPAVDLEFEPGAELGTMRGDLRQLEQVLMNLSINARDAMARGGRLRISTANVALASSPPAADGTEVPDGQYVELRVTDSGEGMSRTTRERIFEPFFSTKPPGKGTGLGLATVLGIVKQCGGYVWVESELGQGTTFRLAFPRVEPVDAEARAAAAPATAPGHGEHLLLVDDEPLVLRTIQMTLTRAGYRVSTAGDGEEALAFLAAAQGLPDLVISDVMMPRMGGVELARALAQRYPRLPMFFLSGYTEAVNLGEGDRDVECLWKPPKTADLLAAVKRGIERGSAGLPRPGQPSNPSV